MKKWVHCTFTQSEADTLIKILELERQRYSYHIHYVGVQGGKTLLEKHLNEVDRLLGYINTQKDWSPNK